MVWSSCNEGMAAAESATEGDRGSMRAAATIRATTAIAEIVTRIIATSRFRTHHYVGGSAFRFKAMSNGRAAGITFPRVPREPTLIPALDSRAGFRKRCLGRFLHEIVEDSGGGDSNNAGNKACCNELTHRVSPVSE
jgi:hypothetical protein